MWCQCVFKFLDKKQWVLCALLSNFQRRNTCVSEGLLGHGIFHRGINWKASFPCTVWYCLGRHRCLQCSRGGDFRGQRGSGAWMGTCGNKIKLQNQRLSFDLTMALIEETTTSFCSSGNEQHGCIWKKNRCLYTCVQGTLQWYNVEPCLTPSESWLIQ